MLTSEPRGSGDDVFGAPLPPHPLALSSPRPPWRDTSSVSIHVVGADPRGGESPRGEPAEDLLQLSSSLIRPEKIVRGDGDRDHPLGAGRVGVTGRLVKTDRLENNHKLFVRRHSEVTLKVLETPVSRDYAGTPEFVFF